jgi:hypothetical protein
MQKYAYVIMPVGSDPAGYADRRVAIEAALNTAGLVGHFPIDISEDSTDFDLQKALKDLEGSSVVIADLSFERPSCYFELGMAQALGKRTILVAIDGTKIHQACGRGHIVPYGSLRQLTLQLLDALNRLHS